MQPIRRHLNLQAKIILVLVAVILPTFLIVTIAENKLTLPILEEEIKQIGIHSGKTLASEIDRSRLLNLSNPAPALENSIAELIYAQPDIVRIDVAVKQGGGSSSKVKVIASNVEDDPNLAPLILPLVDTVMSEFKLDEEGSGFWEILIPIEHRTRDPKGPRKLLGTVRVTVSTKVVGRLVSTLWKTTATAAGLSVISLILALSYFLRKTITNDRLLREAETQNVQLTEQLHDAERQLMNTEKLAVMGQLTASFAHEIGTPLNAIGLHLQLLKEEIPQVKSMPKSNTQSSEKGNHLHSTSPGFHFPTGGEQGASTRPTKSPVSHLNHSLELTSDEIRTKSREDQDFQITKEKINARLGVVDGQLHKIEKIVKGFLQSTAKPTSQKQLVDLNRLVDKTLGIVLPRMELLGVDLKREFGRELGPIRVVPLEIEQVLLNLFNNSLDSIKAKAKGRRKNRFQLHIETRTEKISGQEWLKLSVYDTGEGIRKVDLKNVLKPFYTTKRPDEGTGLGLTICQELLHHYGGELMIESKEGAWTKVTLQLPYHANV